MLRSGQWPLAIVASLLLAGCSSAADTAVTPHHPVSIVVIGDSISSGEGINYGYAYDPNPPRRWYGGEADPTWTGPHPLCHVSDQAYGDVVAKDLGATLHNFACTGSTYENGIVGPRVSGGTGTTFRPAQFGNWATRQNLNPGYDEARPDIVVITVGANDVDFSGVVSACIAASVFSPNECTSSNPGSTVTSRVLAVLPGLTQNYHSLVAAIQARGRDAKPAKVPFIIFVTYPNPLPDPGTDLSIGACLDAAHLSAQQVSYLSSLVSRLNDLINQSVNGMSGVAVADAGDAYRGHQQCSANPWVYGPSILLTHPFSSAPYHPTPSGQSAIARAVLGVIPSSLRQQ